VELGVRPTDVKCDDDWDEHHHEEEPVLSSSKFSWGYDQYVDNACK
jgi:hypothetical protein